MLSKKLNAILLLIIIIFSSVTLWLIDSWIKYPLFIFEVLAIIVLFLILNNYDFRYDLHPKFNASTFNVGFSIDVIFIVSAFILLLLNFYSSGSASMLRVVLALIVTSILPGYALMNIFGLTQNFSKLEKVVLSFIFSYAFTGFLSLILLGIGYSLRIELIIGICVLLSGVSAIKHKKQGAVQVPRSLSLKIDSLALITVILFFVISFCFIYPGFALIPGTDISRHFSSSVILGRTPDLYTGSIYLLSHLHESVFIAASGSTFDSIQTTLAILNLMLPLAFYVMSKPYLEKIDRRLPSLATLFWVLFTNGFGGFSWLYFVYQKLSFPDQSQIFLLNITADKTYNGTIYGILGLWYVPVTVSFVILMTAFFFLSKKDVPQRKYISIFAILIASLYLTHITEAVVFAIFLSIYG